MEKDLSTDDELIKPQDKTRDKPQDKTRDKPQNIGSLIQRFVSDCDIAAKLKKFSIFNHWEEIVGNDLGSRTKPEKISRAILYISVANSTWANELSMMSGQILGKINSFIGSDVIKELRFKVK